MKIYYRQLRGDKYSLINCVGFGNPDVHYKIVEIEEGGQSEPCGI